MNLFNIIVPTYKRLKELEVLICCFLCQTDDDWMMTIISDGKEDTKYEMLKKRYGEYLESGKIIYSHLPNRLNQYGHPQREKGLQNSETKWTLITNDDNYYVPTFIEYLKKHIKENPESGMILFDFVLDHERHGLKYNGHISTRVAEGHIDIGSFVFKTNLGKIVMFPYRDFNGDHKFARELRKKIFKNKHIVTKIPQVLCIHN